MDNPPLTSIRVSKLIVPYLCIIGCHIRWGGIWVSRWLHLHRIWLHRRLRLSASYSSGEINLPSSSMRSARLVREPTLSSRIGVASSANTPRCREIKKEISGNSWLSVEEWNPILASEDADTHIIGTLKTASRRCVACSPNGTLFNNLCQHPLAGFAFASKNMPKGVGRFSFSAAATFS